MQRESSARPHTWWRTFPPLSGLESSVYGLESSEGILTLPTQCSNAAMTYRLRSHLLSPLCQTFGGISWNCNEFNSDWAAEAQPTTAWKRHPQHVIDAPSVSALSVVRIGARRLVLVFTLRHLTYKWLLSYITVPSCCLFINVWCTRHHYIRLLQKYWKNAKVRLDGIQIPITETLPIRF